MILTPYSLKVPLAIQNFQHQSVETLENEKENVPGHGLSQNFLPTKIHKVMQLLLGPPEVADGEGIYRDSLNAES